MTESLVKEAVKQVEKDQMDNPVLFVLGKNWSTGIIGLISGKIKDKYSKPCLVMAENNGEITGSGRSIEGFSLIGALQQLPELFQKFGGHPMACGFTLNNADLINTFKAELTRIFKEQTAGLDLHPTLLIDAEIDLDKIDWELYDILEKFQPFGQSNEKPKYLASNLTIAGLDPVGRDKKHLRIMVKHNSHKIKKTICWDLSMKITAIARIGAKC